MLRTVPRKLLMHALCWLIFITYEVSVVLAMGGKGGFFRFAGFYALDILLFYGNTQVFSRAFRSRYIVAALVPLVLLELATFTALTIAVNIIIDSAESGFLVIDISRLDYVRAIWRGIYILGLSIAYWFTVRSFMNARKANQLQIQKLEGERREAALENAQLRAQINPHLLFNSLNFIYNSIESVSSKASEGILMLADVMRYAMSKVEADGKTALNKEIEQIMNYIALNQLRFGNKLYIDISITDVVAESELRIPPLLLLTFIENIFKHGNLSDLRHPARIEISLEQNQLRFFSFNVKRTTRLQQTRDHIGIRNVRTRLQACYRGTHHLQIVDEGSTFIVELTISL